MYVEFDTGDFTTGGAAITQKSEVFFIQGMCMVNGGFASVESFFLVWNEHSKKFQHVKASSCKKISQSDYRLRNN